MSILWISDFTAYLHASKIIFLQQWWPFLSSHCNVTILHCDGRLYQIQRETSFYLAPDNLTSVQLMLPPILVCNITDGNVWMKHLRYDGSCHILSRNHCISELQKSLFFLIDFGTRWECNPTTSIKAGLQINGSDNFQHGNQLYDQWGGKLSKSLIVGPSTKAAHHLFPFLDFRLDLHKMETIQHDITFTHNESIYQSSPNSYLTPAIFFWWTCWCWGLQECPFLAKRSSHSHEYENDVQNKPLPKILLLWNYARQCIMTL